MPTILNEVEVRVLGSLVEKQVTTPEYYPLTLNSLTLACNQKNNRHPVTSLSEATVAEAIESLRDKNLVYVFYGSTSRVPKYKHVMPEVMHLSQPDLFVIPWREELAARGWGGLPVPILVAEVLSPSTERSVVCASWLVA